MKSALIQLLLKRNIFASRRLGQNFLIDPNFFKYIIRAANISESDDVIEIGSGPGILTELLSRQARSVIAVDIDQKLISLARESLGGQTNIQFINADILNKSRTEINTDVARHLSPGICYKTVSNLPYKTAVPIIMTLLESCLPRISAGLSADSSGALKIKSMLVMTQWEAAERLVASTGTAQYSSLSVRAQYLADIRIDRKVPPEVFYPKPKVQSALIVITPKNNIDQILYTNLKSFVSAVFRYRRKTVNTALQKSGLFGDKQNIQNLLSKAGIECRTRPEDIGLEDYIKLSGLL
ncbi:MAG: 16S rRNA (adenine(1518)-N(6)/adenine(1519)-N(6))-dimethyltransferase RsmA [Planctomycetota bacterium]